MERKIYQELASKINAMANCEKSGNTEWYDKHEDAIQEIIENLPHGSGIDGTTSLDFDATTENKIVIRSEYHTMNEHGYYGRWISFTLTIKPSLQFGIDLKVTGNFGKHQNLKDYLYEVFDNALNEYMSV